MKHFYILLPLLILISCGSTKEIGFASHEQDIYDVLNVLLASPEGPYITDSLIMDELQATNEDDIGTLYHEESKDTVSRRQAAEIFAAAKDTVAFKLKTQYLTSTYHWIASEKIQEMFKGTRYAGWDPLFSEYGERSYRIISKPLFSADGTVAVVATRLRGDWSASGRTFILKKINGKWVVLRISRQWIS